jgi:hypothetical protein
MLVTLLPIILIVIVAGIILFRISANKGKNAGVPKVGRTIRSSSGDQPTKQGPT